MKVTLLYITFFLTSWFSNAQVVINEIDFENPGANDFQIIELKTLPETRTIPSFFI